MHLKSEENLKAIELLQDGTSWVVAALAKLQVADVVTRVKDEEDVTEHLHLEKLTLKEENSEEDSSEEENGGEDSGNEHEDEHRGEFIERGPDRSKKKFDSSPYNVATERVSVKHNCGGAVYYPHHPPSLNHSSNVYIYNYYHLPYVQNTCRCGQNYCILEKISSPTYTESVDTYLSAIKPNIKAHSPPKDIPPRRISRDSGTYSDMGSPDSVSLPSPSSKVPDRYPLNVTSPSINTPVPSPFNVTSPSINTPVPSPLNVASPPTKAHISSPLTVAASSPTKAPASAIDVAASSSSHHMDTFRVLRPKQPNQPRKEWVEPAKPLRRKKQMKFDEKMRRKLDEKIIEAKFVKLYMQKIEDVFGNPNNPYTILHELLENNEDYLAEEFYATVEYIKKFHHLCSHIVRQHFSISDLIVENGMPQLWWDYFNEAITEIQNKTNTCLNVL